MNSTSSCQFAGEGCKDERYYILGVLLALACLATGYDLFQLCGPRRQREHRVLYSVCASHITALGAIVSRFFLEFHSWATSVLFILSFLFILGVAFFLIAKLLLRPITFMGISKSLTYKLALVVYFGWSFACAVLLLLSNAQLDLNNVDTYMQQISVFFAMFGVLILGFLAMLAWTASYLLQAMRRVNQSYDRHARHSSNQRKNLIYNTQRLVRVLRLVCLVTAAMAFALCAVSLTTTPGTPSSTSSLTTSILWFFVLTGLLSLGSVITTFFGEEYLCCATTRRLHAQQQRMRRRTYRLRGSHGSQSSSALGAMEAPPLTIPQRLSSGAKGALVRSMPSPFSSHHSRKRPPQRQSTPSPRAQEGRGFYYENSVAEENHEPFPDFIQAEGSLYEKIGGKPAVDRAVHIFYGKMLADPRVSHFFGGVPMNILKKKQEMFIILVTGGPAVYTGASLRQAHARLNIDAASFDISTQYIRETFQELGVAQEYIDIIAARVELFKSEVLGLVGNCEVVAVS